MDFRRTYVCFSCLETTCKIRMAMQQKRLHLADPSVRSCYAYEVVAKYVATTALTIVAIAISPNSPSYTPTLPGLGALPISFIPLRSHYHFFRSANIPCQPTNTTSLNHSRRAVRLATKVYKTFLSPPLAPWDFSGPSLSKKHLGVEHLEEKIGWTKGVNSKNHRSSMNYDELHFNFGQFWKQSFMMFHAFFPLKTIHMPMTSSHISGSNLALRLGKWRWCVDVMYINIAIK